MKHLIVVALGLLMTACSPVVQEQSPAIMKGQIKPDIFLAETGHELPMRSWLPKRKPKAVLVALHGFNDYSRAFEVPAWYLSGKGIAVYAYDQRGFGANKQAGIWAGSDAMIADLKAFVKAVKRKHKGVPVYVLGESMGGAVVLSALSEPDMPQVAGAILSAPGVWGEDALPVLYRGTLWAMAHLVPGQKLTGDNLKILATSNIDMLRQMSKDKLVIKGTRVDAIYGLVDLMDRGAVAKVQTKAPMLVLYGAHDQVIPPPALMALQPKLRDKARFSCYPQGYHMLLRDLEANVVLNDIASWMLDKRKSKPLPSGGEDILEQCMLLSPDIL